MSASNNDKIFERYKKKYGLQKNYRPILIDSCCKNVTIDLYFSMNMFANL